MKSEGKHDPLPWKAIGADVCAPADDGITNSYKIIEGRENAAFIVKACNAYEDLLDAVKEAYRMTAPLSVYGRKLAALIAKSGPR